MNATRVARFRPVLLIGLFFSLSAFLLAGEGKRFGVPIDPNAPKVTLAELVAKPEPYEGKYVVVQGHFAGACGDGDFYFKDKFEIIEADPPDPEVNSLKKGTPIRLYGLVKVHRSGSGEAEKGEEGEKKERGEKEKKRQVYVKIVGKAVEVIK